MSARSSVAFYVVTGLCTMDLLLLCKRVMNETPEASRALLIDFTDLLATLHLLSEAAARRGESDSHGALRLLARCGEQLFERLEQIIGDE